MRNEGKNVSIKMRLLFVVLPVVAVVLAVLVVVSYLISSRIIQTRSEGALESSISSQTFSIEGWLQENLEAFAAYKQMIEQTHPDEVQLQNIIESSANYNANYPEGVYIGESSGKLWKSSNSTKRADGMAEAIWYKEGLSRMNMRYGTAYQNDNGEHIVSASAILNDGTEPPRVIAADVTLERISVIVNSFVEMKDAKAFLVDSSSKTILAHEDASLIYTKLGSNGDAYLQEIAKCFDAHDFTKCVKEDNLTVFSPVAGTNWILVSYIPEDIIFADVRALRTSMIIISIFALLLIVVIVERSVHMVMKPVRGLTDTINALSDGDFTVQVDTEGTGEIGKMGRSMSDFITSIRGMLAEVQSISDRVQQQSANTNGVSGEMHQVAEVQADSMRQLNDIVDNLAESINEISDSASTLALVVSDTKSTSEKVEEHMRQTVMVSEKGKKDMQQVSEVMNDIRHSIQNLGVAIGKVGETSNKITNIVSVIGSIADETNLLSLNASIEAARAGEAGQGFAVVASEIGKLASTSAESVDSIVALIGDITRLIDETVQQAKVSMESIDESSKHIETAVSTFDVIFNDIHATSEMIQHMMDKVDEVDEVATNVAAISEEQSASTSGIQDTSESMMKQAKNIAGNSEKVLSDAQELSEEALQLTEHLKRFRIG